MLFTCNDLKVESFQIGTDAHTREPITIGKTEVIPGLNLIVNCTDAPEKIEAGHMDGISVKINENGILVMEPDPKGKDITMILTACNSDIGASGEMQTGKIGIVKDCLENVNIIKYAQSRGENFENAAIISVKEGNSVLFRIQDPSKPSKETMILVNNGHIYKTLPEFLPCLYYSLGLENWKYGLGMEGIYDPAKFVDLGPQYFARENMSAFMAMDISSFSMNEKKELFNTVMDSLEGKFMWSHGQINSREFEIIADKFSDLIKSDDKALDRFWAFMKHGVLNLEQNASTGTCIRKIREKCFEPLPQEKKNELWKHFMDNEGKNYLDPLPLLGKTALLLYAPQNTQNVLENPVFRDIALKKAEIDALKDTSTLSMTDYYGFSNVFFYEFNTQPAEKILETAEKDPAVFVALKSPAMTNYALSILHISKKDQFPELMTEEEINNKLFFDAYCSAIATDPELVKMDISRSQDVACALVTGLYNRSGKDFDKADFHLVYKHFGKDAGENIISEIKETLVGNNIKTTEKDMDDLALE